MCRVFMVNGDLTADEVRQIIRRVNKSFKNNQRDGFGFVGLGDDGSIYRGRYESPDRFPGKFRAQLPEWLSGNMSEEGEIPAKTISLLVHGRTSTNIVSLANTHPFEYKNFYLIHNGVVTWTGKKEDEPPFECDSEQFLHWVVDAGMDWDKANTAWSGWGVVGLLDGERKTMTVAVDTGGLKIARRVGGGWVMSTQENDLVDICYRASIHLDTDPVSFPRRIVCFRGGDILSDRTWAGFGSRAAVTADILASNQCQIWDKKSARKNKKFRKEKESYTSNGKIISPSEPESFPDWESAGSNSWPELSV